jgi:hemerythrin-like domain-containing protein
LAGFPNEPPAHAFAEHEHRELGRGIDRIREVAGIVGTIAAPDLSIALIDVLDWIETVLEPHAAWEDAWLYPQIDRRAGTPWATRLMTFEHHQIRAFAGLLESDRERLHHELTRDQAVQLVGHLFALDALLRAHIEREERVLRPLLEDDAERRKPEPMRASVGQ